MHLSTAYKTVLLLAHGGPSSIDEIPEFLSQIRGHKPVSSKLLLEVTRRYRQIGGASPLRAITASTAKKLEERIGRPVHFAMKYGKPSIKDVVGNLCKPFLAICLAPHESALSTGGYEAKVNASATCDWRLIRSWYDEPLFIESMARRLKPFAAHHVVFTAHSLPKKALSVGDPYEGQVIKSAKLIAKSLSIGPSSWSYCFQSAGLSGDDWLGPFVEEKLAVLAGKQILKVVIVPVGFVCEHVEILYDIDIALKRIAERLGVELARIPMLNDGDDMIDILAALCAGNGIANRSIF